MFFCNINITDVSREKLFQLERDTQVLIPMNAECFVKSNKNADLLNIVNKYRTTLDGQIPFWLYKSKYKKEKACKISGSEIIYEYCEWAALKNLKVFFLGGKELANLKAVEKIKSKYNNISIAGFSPPFESYPFSNSNNDNILKKIEEFQPDIIFVGFGFGKQERWIDANITSLKQMGIRWIIACGGSFEFISGEIKRAPRFIQRLGFEGAWRLCMEPKWFRVKRLLVSFLIFKYL